MDGLRRGTGIVTPAWGAEVMATGIVSVGLHLAGVEWASLALLVIAAVLWVLLGAVFAGRLGADRARWTREAVTPAALTGVAGTGVLGVRLSLLGWRGVAALLLVIAAVLWAVLLPAVVRHLRDRLPGAAYLVCVSTQSLAVLAATLAATEPGAWPFGWLLWPAGLLFLVGLALYAMVLSRFDLAQLRVGAGDHWVAGGALAISALAAGKLAAATPATARDPLVWATLAVLAAALAWYAVLVVCEVRWPRWRYDVRRWSTVFPLGMTAVATITAASVAGLSWLGTAGEVLLWPAVIVWAVVGTGALRHLSRG
ncbi:tellurite resistance/C4-dicarboxylate transporter family protein [Actinomadura flavalba]|uniref:tellurite resistance/C4-dicarboxylate transporter family protein n=1 Tax=Actinomadura flavalba TaxID=1120938 RepID=UPI00037A1F81|nr:tellurite resistance/C4-dicarboxylate transporter family protein [Actinomadura flavalba]